MSVTVEFHRLAADEFRRARRWYGRRSAAAEGRFVLAVRKAVGRIEANPTGGSPATPPFRWVKVPRYPYLLHYRPLGTAVVEVTAVAHASRRPGYWLGRTRRP